MISRRDGEPDLALGFLETDGHIIAGGAFDLRGDGDGTFNWGKSQEVIPGLGASAVITGDFNGDGIADLAALSVGKYTDPVFLANLIVYAGDGNGLFSEQASYPAGLRGAIALGDFNQDGRVDFAIAVGNQVNVLLGSSATSPSINAGGIVNAATFAAPATPGSIATVFGNFAVDSAAAGMLPLPTKLSGVSVLISVADSHANMPAPLLSVSDHQITFQVPWELATGGSMRVNVTVNGQTSGDGSMVVTQFAPGVFTTNFAGVGQGAILDGNYQLVDATNPAVAGRSVVQIYCTGLGVPVNPPATGVPAPDASSVLAVHPSVRIGGLPATVVFAGLTPGTVGLYQLNVLVPAGSPAGSAVPVVVRRGEVLSNMVTMAVAGASPAAK